MSMLDVARFEVNSERANLNCNRHPQNTNGSLEIVWLQDFNAMVKTYTNLYEQICSLANLIAAWKKARRGKTKKPYVKKFEEDIAYNLKIVHDQLKNKSYTPKSLVTFVLRDPKTRTISKSAFRDRIVHHALVRIIQPLFDETFMFDSCANRIGKGSLFALQRFNTFTRKVTYNLKKEAFCLKADIKQILSR